MAQTCCGPQEKGKESPKLAKSMIGTYSPAEDFAADAPNLTRFVSNNQDTQVNNVVNINDINLSHHTHHHHQNHDNHQPNNMV